jgi:hypothetical protein
VKKPIAEMDNDQQSNRKPEELTPEEIKRRQAEKAQILRDFTATRPVRVTAPQARPVTPVPTPTPAGLEQLYADLAAARAELAAYEASYKEAVKLEREVKVQAERDHKDHLAELNRRRDEIQRAADEAAEAVRAVTLAEIANQTQSTLERNQALTLSKGEVARQALRDQARPWLHEVEFAMRRAREIDQQYRQALETFASLTVSSAPAEFPAEVRNALSAKVYRPAERALDHLNIFLAGAREEYGGEHIETVLRRIVETGEYTRGSIAELKFAATMAFNRDGVESIKSQISIITAELSRLYAEGRAAVDPGRQSQPIPTNPDRLEAKRDLLTSGLTSSRQTEAAGMGGRGDF